MSYTIVAKSQDGKRAVVTENNKYAVIKLPSEEVIGNWGDERVLTRMVMKGGFEKVGNIEKSLPRKRRKATQRVDEALKKDKDKGLVHQLGLENFVQDVTNPNVWKSEYLHINVDIQKADNSHLPKKAERFSYNCTENYNIIYIPVNRLKEVYQTKEALNPSTIKRKAKEMKSGKPMPPVYIGYNYDVHDGHHSWNAAMYNDYTHVPCKVVGSDPEKVKQAIEEYKKVWKSEGLKVIGSTANMSSIDEVRELLDSPSPRDYTERLERLKARRTGKDSPNLIIDENKRIDPVEDEKVWKEKVEENDTKFRKELGISKADVLVVDLSKAMLNTGKLVKRRVAVKGKGGQIFYRMQWVKPEEADKGDFKHPGVDHTTFAHHTDGIKDMEKRQSNKFPVIHHPTNKVKIREHNYTVDKDKLAQAEHAMKHGEKLPPLRINPHGEVLDNHHLVDLARKHGLSHIPSIVIGNTTLKKELENRLKDEVVMKDGDEEFNLTSNKDGTPSTGEVADLVSDSDHFKRFTSRKYTKTHLMDEARRHGITWNEYDKDGAKLPENSKVMWMRAHQAIVKYIDNGNNFEVTHDEKDVDRRMEQDGKDSIHKYFVKLLEKHNGDQDSLMDWARDNGIGWKEEHRDPSINWMRAVVAIKKELAKGRMLDGVRTRQKGAMTDANRIVTEEVKGQVKALGSRYGKSRVMKRAEELGIQFSRFTNKGTELPENSNILWMRAHEAISRYISDGNNFLMGDEKDTGIKAEVGDYGGVKLSKYQSYAVDLGKRKSRNREEKTRKWMIKSLMIDKGISEEEANGIYENIMEKARNARLRIHFDPEELLTNGSTLLEQLSSDGHIKNDYELDRGFDRDSREIDERYLFGDDYDEASDKERPVYGSIDLFNKGLDAHPYGGDIAFVLNEDVKKRATGSHMDSSSIAYGDEGRWLRSMEDPHQLIMDRWTSKWKQPKNADKQRERAFDAISSGKPYHDDNNFFEAHIHGGINLARDVSHIEVPERWIKDKSHKDKLDKVEALAKLHGLEVKWSLPSDRYIGEPTSHESKLRLRGLK